jgi:hypothetical protein
VNPDPKVLQHPSSTAAELTLAKGIPKFAVAGFDRRARDGRPRLADEHRVTTSTDCQSWIDRSYGRDRPQDGSSDVVPHAPTSRTFPD